MRVELVVPFVVLPVVSALQQYAVSKSRDTRPNILFLMTDSMDGRLVDSESRESKGVDLPFLRDFLGTKGANFVNSYAHNPMCTPSRTSTMTGRTSYNISVWGNSGGIAASPGGVMDEDCVAKGEDLCKKLAESQGYPEHIFSAFQKLGYNVTVYGRLHLGAALLNAEPNDDMVDGEQSYSAFGKQTFDELTRAANIPASVGDSERGQFLDNVSLVDGDNDNTRAGDWMTVSNCKNLVQDLPSPSQATQPFFLHCSFNIPHYPFSTNSTWLANVHADGIPLPTFPDEYHPYDNFMATSLGVDVANITTEDVIKLKEVYYAMVAEADYMLQSIWDSLVDKGYSLDDTYIVYVSDHGELAFDHRLVYKASMYEGSIRVPIQLAGPGITQGQRVTLPTSLLDIFPTLLDMAGESQYSKYNGLAGQSLLSVAGGTSVAPANMTLSTIDGRDAVVSNYNWVETNTGAYMVRCEEWKLIYYGHTFNATKDYQPRLFNIDDDSDELNDVAADYPDIVERLGAKLREVMDPDEVDLAVMKNVWEDFLREYPCLLSLSIESNWDECVSTVEEGSSIGGMIQDDDDRAQLLDWRKEALKLFGSSTD